jgi:AraC-like DNA-binding protein
MTFDSSARFGAEFDQNIGADLDCASAGLHRDPVMARFIEVLLPQNEADQVLRGFYTSALHATLLSRLSELRAADGKGARRKLNPLPKWRLRRVYEFVDANIEERISLEALAHVAGVSRMYFAAQFRAATGFRPHDYLVGRRIAIAKEMLSVSGRAIVDVALSVGFQTQAHFTTVFKRVEGCTPHRWREAHNADRAMAS